MRNPHKHDSTGVQIVEIQGWKGSHTMVEHTDGSTGVQIDVEDRVPGEIWDFEPTLRYGVLVFFSNLKEPDRLTQGRETLVVRVPKGALNEGGQRITLQFRP